MTLDQFLEWCRLHQVPGNVRLRVFDAMHGEFVDLKEPEYIEDALILGD